MKNPIRDQKGVFGLTMQTSEFMGAFQVDCVILSGWVKKNIEKGEIDHRVISECFAKTR